MLTQEMEKNKKQLKAWIPQRRILEVEHHLKPKACEPCYELFSASDGKPWEFLRKSPN